MAVDPITFQLIRNALESMADEMALTIVRTAYSTVVRDNMDFSAGFCNKDGELSAQSLSIPFHLGSIPEAMRTVRQRFGDSMRPGDVFCLNDPYDGGSHLPDIFVIKPIFYGDRIAGYAANICHHTDVGGRVPGSNASDSTEIFQEGLRIPPSRLYAAGEPNETLFNIIERNVRVPEKVLGDLRAQLAACHICETRVREIIDKYGFETTDACLAELLDYTERLTRREIARLKDGVYHFTDFIDNDGIDPDPIKIQVALTKQGDQIEVDFAGSQPQVRGAINSPLSFTTSTVYVAVHCALGPSIPNNAGMFRAITVKAPPGSVVNPRLPGSCAARALTGVRMLDTCFGALAQFVPERVMAAGNGGSTGVSIGGYYDDGKPFIFVEFLANSWGARPDKDGIDGISSPSGNLALTPIEVIEAEYPLRVERYGLAPDSGGAGRWRGGLAAVRDLRFLGRQAILQVRSDRRQFRPYGLAGGKEGGGSVNVLNPDRGGALLPQKITRELKHGDLFHHITPGSGGYGDPFRREPERVLADVMEGKVTVQAAREQYGVAIDPAAMQVDAAATQALRHRHSDSAN